MLAEQARIRQEEAEATQKTQAEMEMIQETCSKIEQESNERDIKIKNLMQVNLELQN